MIFKWFNEADYIFKKRTTKESHRLIENIFIMSNICFVIMNVYLFWILFLSLWAIVPLMIIKGRKDQTKKVKTVPDVKAKKKGWFN